MKIPLLVVTVVGIAIGLALPSGRTSAPAAIAAAPADDQPVETVLDRRPSGHFIAVADVNGAPTRFVVDTGADIVALTMRDAKRAHVAFDPARFGVIGRGASGEVRGQEVRIAKIVLDGKRATNVRGVVLEDSDMSLLGHSYLRRIADVRITGDTMILR